MEIYAETAMSILIEKNKRLQGAIYNYDVFGKLGAPKEISYFEVIIPGLWPTPAAV